MPRQCCSKQAVSGGFDNRLKSITSGQIETISRGDACLHNSLCNLSQCLNLWLVGSFMQPVLGKIRVRANECRNRAGFAARRNAVCSGASTQTQAEKLNLLGQRGQANLPRLRSTVLVFRSSWPILRTTPVSRRAPSSAIERRRQEQAPIIERFQPSSA